MRMWNEYDLDLCEARKTIIEETEFTCTTITEYYLDDGSFTGCRDANVELKQGFSTESLSGA